MSDLMSRCSMGTLWSVLKPRPCIGIPVCWYMTCLGIWFNALSTFSTQFAIDNSDLLVLITDRHTWTGGPWPKLLEPMPWCGGGHCLITHQTQHLGTKLGSTHYNDYTEQLWYVRMLLKCISLQGRYTYQNSAVAESHMVDRSPHSHHPGKHGVFHC